MSTVTRRRAFGLDAARGTSPRYVDGTTICTVAGASVVLHDASTGHQRFVPPATTRAARTISATCAHAGTSTIATCASDGTATVEISTYDSQTMKRTRTLRRDTKRHAGSREEEDVVLDGFAFSDDGDKLVAYSTLAHALICWNLNLSNGSPVELPPPRRVGASSETSSSNARDFSSQITHVSFSPHDHDVISAVCTGGTFKTYRVTDTTIKLLTVRPLNQLMKDEGREALTHAWLKGKDKHVAIGTSTGEVIILDEDSVVCTVGVYRGGGSSDESALPAVNFENGVRVSCIAMYKSGFIAAGDRGDVVIVTRVPTRKQLQSAVPYKCVKRIAACESSSDDLFDTTPSNNFQTTAEVGDALTEDICANAEQVDAKSCEIMGLDVSPTGDSLICTLVDKRVLFLSLTNADIMQAKEMKFKCVLTYSHLGSVSSMDICRGRAIMLSVSASDKSMKVWNLASNSCEISKDFLDNPLSVSMHPSGWIACVGFSDKLRLMHILNCDLRTVKEFTLKACRVVEFSKGGHFFASAVGATVYVHHTFTHECIAVLRGHCGKVKSLTWDSNDANLISSGADGAIYEWDIRAASRDDEKARVREHVRKGSIYTSIATIRHTGGIVACSSDAKLREFDTDFKVTREFSSEDVVLTHVAYSASAHVLLAATSAGGVRAYKVPLTGEYAEYHGHSSSITALRLSQDGFTLHTTGSDGCIFTFDVRDAGHRIAEASSTLMKSADGTLLVDEVLIARDDLGELHQRISELQTHVKEVSLQAQYQLRLQAASMNEKLKCQAEEAARSLDYEKERVSALQLERDTILCESKDELKRTVQDNENRLISMENEYTSKIFAEVRRFNELKAASDAAKVQWDELNAQCAAQHEESVEQIKKEFAMRVTRLKEEIEKLEKEREQMRETFGRARKVIDEEVDCEIEQLKASFEERIRREHEDCLILRGENGVAKTKYAIVRQHEDDRLREIESLTLEKSNLADKVADLEREVQHLHETVDTHERVIERKNELLAKGYSDMSRADECNTALLSEIAAMKSELVTLEDRENERTKEIETMNDELQRYYDSNSALVRQVRDIKSQRDALQRDLARTRKQTAHTAAVVKRFQHDLHTCVGSIQDAKSLKERVKSMYHKYTADDTIDWARDEATESEERRQRDHLEKTVAALRRQLETETGARRSEFHRIMRENHSLMEELASVKRLEMSPVKRIAS